MDEPVKGQHGEGPEADIGAEDPVDPDSVARLMDERDALLAEKERLLRHCADFQNQVLRARKDVAEARKQGVSAVCRDVIGALDHFDVALAQDMGKATVDSIMEGMRAIRGELIRAMSNHGVVVIEPQPGDEFDPSRHEAVMRRPAEGDIPPGHILSLFQVGYMLDEWLIRPAKVVVAES